MAGVLGMIVMPSLLFSKHENSTWGFKFDYIPNAWMRIAFLRFGGYVGKTHLYSLRNIARFIMV